MESWGCVEQQPDHWAEQNRHYKGYSIDCQTQHERRGRGGAGLQNSLQICSNSMETLKPYIRFTDEIKMRIPEVQVMWEFHSCLISCKGLL